MDTTTDGRGRASAETVLAAAGFRVLGHDTRVPGGLTAWQRGSSHAQTDDTGMYLDGATYGWDRLNAALEAISRGASR